MTRRSGVVALGVGAVAVICCAGPALVTGAIGGLTLAAVLGLGAGAVAVAALVIGAVLVLRRRRRRCEAPVSPPGTTSRR